MFEIINNKLDKLKDKFDEFNIYLIDNKIIIISFLLFIISIYYVKNTYLIIILYLLILYFARNYEKAIIKFISVILPIVILGYVLMCFVRIRLTEQDMYIVLRIIIKILMIIDCLFVLYYYFKMKKTKKLNLLKRNHRKYTFKELRLRNIDKFRNSYNEFLDEYLENNKIGLDSDYFKVIENNIDNKIDNNLEEFVWTNYLRFYKNKKFNRESIFNFFNLLFLSINVIILILVLNVR